MSFIVYFFLHFLSQFWYLIFLSSSTVLNLVGCWVHHDPHLEVFSSTSFTLERGSVLGESGSHSIRSSSPHSLTSTKSTHVCMCLCMYVSVMGVCMLLTCGYLFWNFGRLIYEFHMEKIRILYGKLTRYNEYCKGICNEEDIDNFFYYKK